MVVHATVKFCPAITVGGGGVVQVAVGSATAGFTVTDTTAELPDPSEFRTCTTYFTVVGLVIGVPSAFFIGAVNVTGLTVGLTVELSVVSAAPKQQPTASGSMGFQWTLT